ncbi:uncharacterized protein Hap1MRO34_005766 isoform 1-T2 [Clarias gariepinus]|uniref:uncharacterized protein LOC128520180 n=1 Tax=Clarias gariepinus TaxID=13013 RepID=UPI00234CBB55|nr:uncharacterized protein LOC128520180 [Clarias gariepinus]XP_053350264.1 uncharacterized protein LOC128520180 [Clarias gariepinus]
MEPIVIDDDGNEGCSEEASRTTGPEYDSSGKSGVAEHLSLEDLQTLLKVLKIRLPRNVLNDDVIKAYKHPGFSAFAEDIVKILKRTAIRLAPIPRLHCRKVKRAHSLTSQNKILDITLMIFFENRKPNERTLKQMWERIPARNRRGFKMKDTYQEISKGIKRARGGDLACGDIILNQRNEKKCLKSFVKESGLSGVRYRRERSIEFEFLSGRLDFLIKANGSEPGTSENIILECKGTKGYMAGKVFRRPKEGHLAKLIKTHPYYYQTQAYLYMLKKTRPQDASVKAAMVIREYQDDEDEEETDEDEDDQDDDAGYQEYKDDDEEPKGEIYYNYLKGNTRRIEKLNNYCKEYALPLYLAVLNKIFEKERERVK